MKNDSISDAIFNIFHLYRLAMRSRLKASEIDLNAMHVKCLTYIANNEACTANDIVNFLQRDKAQIARLIKEMIERAWLTKLPHPNDKRSQILTLTKEGEELATLIAETRHQVHSKMQQNLSNEDLEHFNRITGVMASNLKDDF